MDNSNLIMRVKIGVHNTGEVRLPTEGYDDSSLEKTVEELRTDGYKARIEKEAGKSILVVGSSSDE